MTHEIYCTGGAWCLEWYRDDDGGSGWGEGAQVQRWHGTHGECAERAESPPDPKGWVTPGDTRP